MSMKCSSANPCSSHASFGKPASQVQHLMPAMHDAASSAVECVVQKPEALWVEGFRSLGVSGFRVQGLGYTANFTHVNMHKG